MHTLIIIVLVAFGGIWNRVRGGLKFFGTFPPIGTQGARALFAVGMGAYTAYAFSSWIMLVTIIAWGICEFLPNGDYLGMANFWQFLEATAVGLGNVSLVCVAGWFLDNHLLFIPLIIAGALKGVVYYVAQKIPSTLSGFKQGAEMAELMFGWVLCAGVALSAVFSMTV